MTIRRIFSVSDFDIKYEVNVKLGKDRFNISILQVKRTESEWKANEKRMRFERNFSLRIDSGLFLFFIFRFYDLLTLLCRQIGQVSCRMPPSGGQPSGKGAGACACGGAGGRVQGLLAAGTHRRRCEAASRWVPAARCPCARGGKASDEVGVPPTP